MPTNEMFICQNGHNTSSQTANNGDPCGACGTPIVLTHYSESLKQKWFNRTPTPSPDDQNISDFGDDYEPDTIDPSRSEFAHQGPMDYVHEMGGPSEFYEPPVTMETYQCGQGHLTEMEAVPPGYPCPSCGTPMAYANSSTPAKRYIWAGALQDPHKILVDVEGEAQVHAAQNAIKRIEYNPDEERKADREALEAEDKSKARSTQPGPITLTLPPMGGSDDLSLFERAFLLTQCLAVTGENYQAAKNMYDWVLTSAKSLG
jgi:hypothetical protein